MVFCLLPAGYLGCKANAQGVPYRGTSCVSASQLAALNPGFQLSPEVLCGSPVPLSSRAEFVKTLQGIEELLLSDEDEQRQQGEQQLEHLVGPEQLGKLLDQLLSWLPPGLQQRMHGLLLQQLDAVVVRLLALQLCAAGLSPFSAGYSTSLFHRNAEVQFDLTAWQQHHASRVQHPDAFVNCLDSISDVGVGSKWGLYAAVFISLRREMTRRGLILPRRQAGHRQGGWEMEAWNAESGIKPLKQGKKLTGKINVTFPGYPALSSGSGSALYLGRTTDRPTAQKLRDLVVEAVLGAGSSLCPQNKGTFPAEHLQGARAWLQQAATTAGASQISASYVFEQLQGNTGLWPPLGQDEEELTAEQLSQLSSLVQQLYGLRSIPQPTADDSGHSKRGRKAG